MSADTMGRRPIDRRWVGGLAAAVAIAALAPIVSAQDTQDAPRPGEVETAPIQCWWKTDTTHVRVGERFTLTLTCGVVETSSITVVASTNGLDPGALQLTPFEVVSGTRRDDIVAPPRRYFQYDYRVRLLSEGFFGQDVSLPPLRVTYNIQSTAGAGQGRDQTYVLPALPMRIASLVPQDATDIRDAVAIGFDAIEARRFRGTSATVGGAILLGCAGVLLLVGGVRAATRVRHRRPATARTVAPAAVLHACVRALGAVREDAARDGWSPAAARRALAVVRIAGAVGIGRTLAQMVVSADAGEREGQLALRQGLVRRRPTMLSASTTATAIDRELTRGHVRPAARGALEAVRDAMLVFTPAGYGRAADMGGPALDEALAQSLTAVRHLHRRAIWPVAGWSAMRAPAAGLSPSSMSEERL